MDSFHKFNKEEIVSLEVIGDQAVRVITGKLVYGRVSYINDLCLENLSYSKDQLSNMIKSNEIKEITIRPFMNLLEYSVSDETLDPMFKLVDVPDGKIGVTLSPLFLNFEIDDRIEGLKVTAKNNLNCNLSVGDIIVFINGYSITGMNLKNVLDMFENSMNRKLTVLSNSTQSVNLKEQKNRIDFSCESLLREKWTNIKKNYVSRLASSQNRHLGQDTLNAYPDSCCSESNEEIKESLEKLKARYSS